MTRLNMRGYSDKMIDNNLSEVKNDHKRTEKKEIHNVIYSYQPNYKTRKYNSSTKSSRVWSVRIQDSKSPPNILSLNYEHLRFNLERLNKIQSLQSPVLWPISNNNTRDNEGQTLEINHYP